MKQFINLLGLMISLIALFNLPLMAQKDLTYYKPTTNFYGKPDTVLTMQLVDVKIPPSVESFQSCFHFPPIPQDTTGTCWAFSGISFLESELYRLHSKKIKLSELFVVYWEYVEKAREYLRTRGKSLFAQGSQSEAVILRMKKYGIVPQTDYTGLLPGKTRHSHKKLHREMKDYLNFVREQGNWDEEIALTTIKLILNKYLGEPPSEIIFNGEKMTPKEFLDKQLQLPSDDYVSLMSFKYQPFWTKGSYKVPDNYWHSQEYYNVPLDQWYRALLNAIQQGFTLEIGGDVSEIGKLGEHDIAIVPAFDIPPEKINQDAREFRFDNKTSADDHGIHLVGYQRYQGHDWFLVKDSGSSSRKGKFEGYYFFRGDYIKLKMLTFMVHKAAVADLFEKKVN